MQQAKQDDDDVSQQTQLRQLVFEQAELTTRLRCLSRQVDLTSAEQVEVDQLKKLQLRARDRIQHLQER